MVGCVATCRFKGGKFIMNQYLSFDIELYNEFPDNEQPDLKTTVPSTAAICTNMEDCQFFDDNPYVTKETAQRLVRTMMDYKDKGFILTGWNILGFDLPLLGHYSGLLEECGRLALNSVDMMFLVVAHKGFFLSLNKALKGAKIEAKLHSVTLNDKTEFSMDGSKAPLLWRSKEFSAVRQYLRVDVEQPLKLAYHIDKEKVIKWVSDSGKNNTCFTEMLTVKEALRLPPPNTSWQTNPKLRSEYYSWIPDNVLVEEGIIKN